MKRIEHMSFCWIAASWALALPAAIGATPEQRGLEHWPLPEEAGLATPTARGGVPVPAQLVTQEGATPPGGNGDAVTLVNTPFTTASGTVGFTGAFSLAGNNDHFVWFDDEAVWRNSSAVGVTLAGAEGTMGVADGGAFIYSPSVDGEDGVWTHNGVLAAAGGAAPGFPVGTVTTFHSRPTMSGSGAAHWIAGFNEAGGTTTQGRVLYTSGDATAGSTVVVLRSDDMVGGFAIDRPAGIGFDYWLSDDGEHHIHVLVLDTGSTTNDGAVYVDGTLVAREAQPSGSGDNWANFDSVSINDAGNYLFSGDTDGATASDEFIAYDGAIVLREGDVVDGVTLATTASVQALSLNDLGQAVHLWTVSGGVEHLFGACDVSDPAATSYRMLSTGDALDFDGDGSGDATVIDFNASGAVGPGLDLAEDGRVFVEVDIDAGSGEVEAVIGLDFPAICNDVIFADGFESPPT